MTYLLDVNALIALIWTDHASHTKAEKWTAGKSLATCPFSEVGFLRVSTNPKALGASMADARKLLADFLKRHRVEFVSADLPALKSPGAKSDEITDLYLAELAASKAMKLATLDQGIRHAAAEVMT
jgi:toxin-antitoxin system PIN domain toxin